MADGKEDLNPGFRVGEQVEVDEQEWDEPSVVIARHVCYDVEIPTGQVLFSLPEENVHKADGLTYFEAHEQERTRMREALTALTAHVYPGEAPGELVVEDIPAFLLAVAAAREVLDSRAEIPEPPFK
jgi:hypothetical protein